MSNQKAKSKPVTSANPKAGAELCSTAGLGIRSKLVAAGVKNLREFGYPSCNETNILTDQIFKAFFVSMLRDNLGKGYDTDIKSLLKECGDPAHCSANSAKLTLHEKSCLQECLKVLNVQSAAAVAGGSADWLEVRKDRRWKRGDGAVVKWEIDSPHPNPCNPRSRLWTCYEPDPSEQRVMKQVGVNRISQDGTHYRLGVPRRFLTAQTAMRWMDAQYPPNNEVSHGGDNER